MSEEVYLFDKASETIEGKGIRTENGSVVTDSLQPDELDELIVIEKESFYQHKAVQDIVPQGTQKTQLHVKCMCCGFETVYGVRALISGNRFMEDRKGYPKWTEPCKECGENVWKEIRRQRAPCDWSDEFEWADPIEG